MRLWLEEREDYLREEMASEGRRGLTRCGGWTHEVDRHTGLIVRVRCLGKAEYRCFDCDGCVLLCKDCVLQAHEACPLHRLQV